MFAPYYLMGKKENYCTGNRKIEVPRQSKCDLFYLYFDICAHHAAPRVQVTTASAKGQDEGVRSASCWPVPYRCLVLQMYLLFEE